MKRMITSAVLITMALAVPAGALTKSQKDASHQCRVEYNEAKRQAALSEQGKADRIAQLTPRHKQLCGEGVCLAFFSVGLARSKVDPDFSINVNGLPWVHLQMSDLVGDREALARVGVP